MDRRSPFVRRAALVGTALFLLLGATGCQGNGPVGAPPVATVEGQDVTFDDIRDLADAQVAFLRAYGSSETSGVDPAQVEATLERFRGANEHTVSTTATSEALSMLVQVEILRGLVAERGGEVTDADRQAAAAQVQEELAQVGVTIDDAMRPYVDTHAERSALLAAVQRVIVDPEAREAQLREIFEANEDAFSIACIQQLVTEDEATATDAAARLDAGEDFAAVAADLSIQPELAEPGLEESCYPRTRLASVFGDPIITAGTGDVVGPNDAQGAWLIGRVWEERPATFEDARAEIEAQVPDQSQAAVEEAMLVAYDAASVELDPRFGTWVPEQGRIAPPVDPLAAAEPAAS